MNDTGSGGEGRAAIWQTPTSHICAAKAFRRFRRRRLACSCFAKIAKKKRSS